MSLLRRNAGLALAALLALLTALAYFRGASGGGPTAPPVPDVAAPQPAAPVVKAKQKARRKLVAESVEEPPAPAKIRGAQLRDKGEAMGGGTPDRVDKAAATPTSH